MEPQIPLTHDMIEEDAFAARKAGGQVRMGETLHIPVLAAICRWRLVNAYKLQTCWVWLTPSHSATATDFSSCACDGEPDSCLLFPQTVMLTVLNEANV